ncbi:MAG: trehalose-phosphatase [Rhodospirillaceae bacterium]|jgi:trehalose 6-phosphate phosphatase|nr:trehalose-phosphatase [Rhodospirillaceae bacterium]|tara:strand:+ start:378 stop:1181 length:804 start_codon:yes stop_codon:yes gene_type:complete
MSALMTDDPVLVSMLPQPDATGSALFLDVDGTLLELAATPDQVMVPASLLNHLGEAHTRLAGALALVSGRQLADLDRLFAPLRLPTAGLHGLETRVESDVSMPAEDDIPKALGDELARLRGLFAKEPRILVEDKGCGLAVHWRQAESLRENIDDEAERSRARLGDRYQLLKGKMVHEIKPSCRNKGTAVRQFMETPRFAGRQPYYFGDDITDEDAFEVVNALDGVSVMVGGSNSTQAHLRLASVTVLQEWLAALAGGDSPPGAQPGL